MLSRRELLAELLLGEDGPASRSAQTIGQSGTWNEVVDLARQWGALPLLGRRLREVEEGPGEPVRARLRRFAAADLAGTALQARHGVEAIALLRERGISSVAFKGLAALATLHRGPRGRSIRDVDILVREQDLEATVSVLASLGFSANLPGSLDDYVAFVRHSPGFAGNQAVTLYGKDRALIDLHWQLGREPAEELAPDRLIARAQEVRFLGQTIPVASPTDCLVLAAHHSVRNNFAPDLTIRDLVDFRSWCGLVANTKAPAADHVRACRLAVPVLAMEVIWAEYRPAASRGAIRGLPRTGPDLAAAERLSELFRMQLKHGPLNNDVVHMLQWSPWKQIGSAAIGGWRGHRRFMRSMEQSLEGAPAPLPRRIWELAGALRRLRPDSMRMLRTLAAAKARSSG
ncbi:MAG: nucleotidyltransferase family protein [Bryobacteraceae bacterium]|nr:nucleotidyltransferase family protein [Bryobacteraceae bacterium]